MREKESMLSDKTKPASFSRFVSDGHRFIFERPRFAFYGGYGHQNLHDIKKEKRRELYENLLQYLIVDSTRILAYPYLSEAKQFLQAPLFEKKGNQWFLCCNTSDLVDFLISQVYAGAQNFPLTLVFDCDAAKTEWREFFSHCFDPMILNNPSVLCSESALKYMKRKENEERVSIILLRSPVEYPCFLLGSSSSVTQELFDLCSHAAFTTERFTCRHQ